MYCIPLAIQKHHILCFLDKLIKSNRGVVTGFRMEQRELCITFTAYRYTHSIAHTLIFQTGKLMKGRRKEAALHVCKMHI